MIELVWSDGGYPSRGAYRDTHRLTEHRHQAWAVDGAPYDPERARRAGARRRARTSSRACAERVRGGGLCVVALDTELLGAALARGRRLAAPRCSPRPSAPALRDRAARRPARASSTPAPAPRAAGHVAGARRATSRPGARPPPAASPGASARPSCARVAAVPRACRPRAARAAGAAVLRLGVPGHARTAGRLPARARRRPRGRVRGGAGGARTSRALRELAPPGRAVRSHATLAQSRARRPIIPSGRSLCSPACSEPAESPPAAGGGSGGPRRSRRLRGRIAARARRSAGHQREPVS